MKRLLCIVSAMDAGGAETFLMKIYRMLDTSKYQMDFCVNVKAPGIYDEEIIRRGGKIYFVPPKSQGIRAFEQGLQEVIRNNGYQYVMRITSNAMGFLDLKIAKKAGAVRCCARSSNSSDGGSMRSRIAHRLGRMLYGKYVDVKIAPSDLAAQYTFGEKAYKNGEVHILHNAVDLSVYQYNETARKEIREAFSIPADAMLIGHIGRFDVQKNHAFLIDIFAEISKQREDARLLLIGKGPLEEEIRTKVHALQLDEKVIFAGVRADVPRLLSAMDVFVFPSFYEGMPNTVIEAQATGLPAVISDAITKEADITGLVEYCPLSEAADVWAKRAIAKFGTVRSNRAEQFTAKQYDIQSVTKEFVKLTLGEAR